MISAGIPYLSIPFPGFVVADKKAEKDKGEEKPEGAEGDAAAAEAGAKKSSLKLILIIVAAVVLVVGGTVGGLVATGVIGGKPKAAQTEGGDHAEEGGDGGHGEEKKSKKTEGSVFYDLGEIMVNISGDGRRQTYLRLVVQLELESEKDKAAIENLKPRIIDNFQSYMRELRLDDLRGSGGLYRLREELLFRVTDAVHPIKVRDVLFQQMLVQ